MYCSALFNSGTMLVLPRIPKCTNNSLNMFICFSPGIDAYQILVSLALLLSDHLQVLPIQHKIMRNNIYIMDEGKA